jgi:hypothetical protein
MEVEMEWLFPVLGIVILDVFLFAVAFGFINGDGGEG